jgi:hypothetical protein
VHGSAFVPRPCIRKSRRAPTQSPPPPLPSLRRHLLLLSPSLCRPSSPPHCAVPWILAPASPTASALSPGSRVARLHHARHTRRDWQLVIGGKRSADPLLSRRPSLSNRRLIPWFLLRQKRRASGEQKGQDGSRRHTNAHDE